MRGVPAGVGQHAGKLWAATILLALVIVLEHFVGDLSVFQFSLVPSLVFAFLTALLAAVRGPKRDPTRGG